MGKIQFCGCDPCKQMKEGEVAVATTDVKDLKDPKEEKSNSNPPLNISKQNFKARNIMVNKEVRGQVTGENVLNKLYHNSKQINYPDANGHSAKGQLLNGQENPLKIDAADEKNVGTDVNAIEKIQSAEHVLTQKEETKIIQALRGHFVFKDITNDLLSMILNDLIYFCFEKGNVIYAEGDEGNYFYILAEGEVESTEKGKFKRKLGQWECFGELSLITQCKREETITCLENVSVFSIDGMSFREIQKKMNEAILKERFNFLNTISIFQSLDNVSKYNVSEKIKLKQFEQGDKIISRGEMGDTLYIIKDGLVSCRIGLKEVRKLGNNDYFGQNAVLIDVKRGLDIIALNKTVCYELSRQDLKEALGNEYIDTILFCFFKHCIESTNNLKTICNDSVINEVFKLFKIKTYAKQEKICVKQKDEKVDSNLQHPWDKKIIIVIEGSIYIEKGFELVGDKGKILGDDIINDFKKSLPEDLIAHPDCIALEVPVEVLAQKMKIDLNGYKQLNLLNRISKLRKLYLFKNLSIKSLEGLASKMKKEKYNPNDVIVQENTPGDTFFLISKGRVRISIQGKTLRDLESGSCFGENVLLTQDGKRTATVTAIDKVICYVLSKKEFDIIFVDKAIKDFLLKKLSLQDTSITLKDLKYIQFLGKGKFGSVSLVHNNKNIYAIKAVSRLSVDKQKILAKYFVNERRVMLSLDHPFIVKMVKSMKNQFFCFFLIEYVNGKNLDEYLSNRESKSNIYETQFYIGSMLLMLDYLQKKFIAHRDIKPSNIMIDANGYLKMIDFGTAKILTDYTSTVIGTPHYIAPEILRGKGYSLSCDFWSVGICMYEIFYGMYPFGHYATEVIEIYKEVLHKDFFFPSESTKFAKINAFIRDLLTKKINLRICNVQTLKKRPLFEGFDWDKLNDFKMNPPFIPPKKDLSQFMNEDNPYESMVGEDSLQFSPKERAKNSSYCPPGYDRKWAEEF